VEKLARHVKEDGGQFVIVELPNRAAYQAEVEQLRPKEYAAQFAALRALSSRLNVPLYAFQKPDECGLTDAGYEDYGHMNAAGARTFTLFLSELIRKEGWLKQ
jgi:hypothetical protein